MVDPGILEELETLKLDISSMSENLMSLRGRCLSLGVEPPSGGDPIYYASAQLDSMTESIDGMLEDIRRRMEEERLFADSGLGSPMETDRPAFGERSIPPYRGGEIKQGKGEY